MRRKYLDSPLETFYWQNIKSAREKIEFHNIDGVHFLLKLVDGNFVPLFENTKKCQSIN